ncbi:mitochondrial carrier domain-containing protein [Catenaria anguillulae PL171]|uniref:Mitochondrial carrier domain-containing protein n=1 Tax=Catenaria anguillulae PL171 TaxID=765915 RepID=A0A1Y2HFU2_9FUNG|nr:mitochondrial carrier domain-containing protein [Catenaria anguillulae PL171]
MQSAPHLLCETTRRPPLPLASTAQSQPITLPVMDPSSPAPAHRVSLAPPPRHTHTRPNSSFNPSVSEVEPLAEYMHNHHTLHLDIHPLDNSTKHSQEHEHAALAFADRPQPAAAPTTMDDDDGGRVIDPLNEQPKTGELQSKHTPTLGLGTMNFIAGTIGGFSGVLAGQPFDTIKVRLQCQGTGAAQQYRGTLHCLTTIIRQETVFGLFKGMSSPLVGVAIVNALLFGVYGTFLEAQLDHPNDTPTLTQIFIAGSGSGLVNSLISCPMELSKIRIQNQTDATHSFVKTKMPHFNSPLHCLRYTVATQGIRGAFLGMVPTVLRETPSYGTYFFAYEALCRTLAKANGYKDEKGAESALRPWQLMLAGGLSGIAGWMSTYPADVIKTKIQSADPGTYRGFMDCARQTIASEGAAGLWRGSMATIVRAFPTNAATFVVWHHAMEVLRKF